MKLVFAEPIYIEEIMKIEEACFIPQIREERELFLKRIKVFPQGFILLFDEVSSKISGYISCELWKNLPENENDFVIGHDVEKAHCPEGKILYISSFGILPEFRGKGIGKTFFREALELICSKNSIKKMILMVNCLWKGAFHIYEDSGFKVCYNIKGIFPTEQNSVFSDGIVMIKEKDLGQT